MIPLSPYTTLTKPGKTAIPTKYTGLEQENQHSTENHHLLPTNPPLAQGDARGVQLQAAAGAGLGQSGRVQGGSDIGQF